MRPIHLLVALIYGSATAAALPTETTIEGSESLDERQVIILDVYTWSDSRCSAGMQWYRFGSSTGCQAVTNRASISWNTQK